MKCSVWSAMFKTLFALSDLWSLRWHLFLSIIMPTPTFSTTLKSTSSIMISTRAHYLVCKFGLEQVKCTYFIIASQTTRQSAQYAISMDIILCKSDCKYNFEFGVGQTACKQQSNGRDDTSSLFQFSVQ